MKKILNFTFAMMFTAVLFMLAACSNGVELNKTKVEIAVSGTVQLEVFVSDETVGDAMHEWTTNRPNVATVSQYGLVTGEATGVAVISVQIGGKRAKCTVKVTVPTAKAVSAVFTNAGYEVVSQVPNFEHSSAKWNSENEAIDASLFVIDGNNVIFLAFWYENQTEADYFWRETYSYFDYLCKHFSHNAGRKSGTLLCSGDYDAVTLFDDAILNK